jgi:hypothetical protein
METPIGGIIAWSGPLNKLPDNFRHCNGEQLDRTKFSELFNAIGTTWGGDGVNLFCLPDLQGFFLRGVSSGSGRDVEADRRESPQPNKPAQGNHGNTVGSVQKDAVQDHWHWSGHPGQQNGANPDNPGVAGPYWIQGQYSHSALLPDFALDVKNNGPKETRVSSFETRPMNAYVYWIIRAS